MNFWLLWLLKRAFKSDLKELLMRFFDGVWTFFCAFSAILRRRFLEFYQVVFNKNFQRSNKFKKCGKYTLFYIFLH